MPLHSPRSPQNMGFVPLSTSHSSNHPDAGIPLTAIRSKSSSTGLRPAQHVSFHPDGMDDGNGEKHGLFHSRAGRRKIRPAGLARQGTGGSDDVSVNAMGRLYNKIVGFSPLTRNLVYIVPVALLLAIPLIVLPITGEPPGDGRDRKDRISIGSRKNADGETVLGPSLFSLFLWIEISWLTLWAGKIVARLLPPIFMFFCGVVSSGTRKYATVLRALEIPLSLFFWALAAWLAFKFYFTDDGFGWVHNLKRILLALFASSAVFLAEKAVVQLISITYHQRSFANRIKHSKREVYLVGLMYEASRKLFPMYCREFAEEDYVINDSIDMILAKHRHKRGGSATPMRLIGEVGRFGDKLTSAFGNIASEITGKQVFNPNAAHSVVVEALEKKRSSEAMARRIWMSFVAEDKEALFVDDIIEVLGMEYKDEAEECFIAMDADQNGDISLDEMVRKVVQIGEERKAIAHSMKDISQALAVFDRVLLFLVLLIVIFIFLACFQSSFITTLATAGTALLSLSFVFAVTTQEFLGSCIFLFVKHPYDVGDRVDIQYGGEKPQLVVEKISLLYTVFTRIDILQTVQIANIQLNNLPIENATRSNAMMEVIDVNVSYETSFEDLELLRLELEKFVRSPENARDFQPDLSITVGGVGNLDKLTLNVVIKHKSNWHNDAIRSARRSKFMCALALALKRVPIYPPGGGYEPLGAALNPSYAVTVSDAFAAEARETANKNKEALRMVPNPAGTDAAEQSAAVDLNTRSPTGGAPDDWAYDNTLNSRDSSAEHNRPSDIESARRNLQLNRESQRGRRKPGEGLSSLNLDDDNNNSGSSSSNNAPGAGLMQYSSQGPGLTQYSSAGYNGSFDVESQAGQQQAAGGAPHTYGVFPPAPRAYSPPGFRSGGGNMSAFEGGPPPAVLPTGSSVSRTQPGQGQGQGQGQGPPPDQGRPGPSQY